MPQTLKDFFNVFELAFVLAFDDKRTGVYQGTDSNAFSEQDVF